MNSKDIIQKIALDAKKASSILASSSSTLKNTALEKIAHAIKKEKQHIQKENSKDLFLAEEKKLSPAMIDRLTIKDETINSMVQGLYEVATLEDPIGSMEKTVIRPNGLQVSRMRIPLGVIGFIFESRPNVTVDAAGLCLKSGNAIILRGGSEALNSNKALALIIGNALEETGIPSMAVQVVPTADRDAVKFLLQQEEEIDLIIPRGGEGLIRFVTQTSRIPVLKHYKGVCHVYVDKSADILMAQNICFNAKVQRPGVCNAMETMLVHKDIATNYLPKIWKQMNIAGVTIKGCEKTCKILPNILQATLEDWPAEYLDLTLAVKVVENINEALLHIEKYGSQHTEVIVTSDYERSKQFIRKVDASAVMVNASTRFNDGGELGLGAEIGISTSKLHAFGPMGLKELTTTKFVVLGDGQIRK